MEDNFFDQFDAQSSPPAAQNANAGSNNFFDQFDASTPPPSAPPAAAAARGRLNPVSQVLSDIANPLINAANQRQIPRQSFNQRLPLSIEDVPDAALRTAALLAGGTAKFASDITSRPVETIADIASSIATSPFRLGDSLLKVGPNAASGDFKAAGGNLRDAAFAAIEFGSLFAPSARGAIAARSAAAGRLSQSEQAALTGGRINSVIQNDTKKALKRLRQADPNIQDAALRASRLNAQGIPATTADFTTRNAQSRLIGAARRDGPAQDIAQNVFERRQADQALRISSSIEQAFGVKGDLLTHQRALEASKIEASAPFYLEAHATPTKITPELTELLRRPPLQKAIAQAEEIAAIDGVKLNTLGKSGLPIVETRTGSGLIRLGGDTERLHYMRKALDDQIDVFRDKTTGKLVLNEKGRALVRLRKKFNESLRNGNPAFEQADTIWSGGTRLEEAIDKGLSASRLTSERKVREFMQSAIASGEEQEFRLGFAQGLIEKVNRGGSVGQNRTLKLLGPENEAIITTVLGDKAGRNFINRIAVEDVISRRGAKINPNSNSVTAEALNQNAASETVSIVTDVLGGNVRKLATGAAKSFGQRKLADAQSKVDAELIRLATDNPDELIRLVAQSRAAELRRTIGAENAGSVIAGNAPRAFLTSGAIAGTQQR